MSWMKWTLAMAGTAMGLRYLSDRRRKRIVTGSSVDARPAQTDRDADTTDWSAASDGTGNTSASSFGSSSGSTSGNTPGNTPGITTARDDLLAPDSDWVPGSSANRF